MNETPQKEKYVTVDRFDQAMLRIDKRFDEVMRRADGQFNELKQFMMDGFTALSDKIDFVDGHLSSRIDELAIIKADKEEVLALYKRVVKIEKKIA